MPDPGRLVRRIVAESLVRPLPHEAVHARIEKYAGRGPLGIGRSRGMLEYIERELADRKGGVPMRSLWNAVADYLATTQAQLAAARRTADARSAG